MNEKLLTLDATLKSLGFGHRATSTTPATQKREIFRLSDGKVVADLTAHEAWEWLRGGHGAPPEGEDASSAVLRALAGYHARRAELSTNPVEREGFCRAALAALNEASR